VTLWGGRDRLLPEVIAPTIYATASTFVPRTGRHRLWPRTVNRRWPWVEGSTRRVFPSVNYGWTFTTC